MEIIREHWELFACLIIFLIILLFLLFKIIFAIFFVRKTNQKYSSKLLKVKYGGKPLRKINQRGSSKTAYTPATLYSTKSMNNTSTQSSSSTKNRSSFSENVESKYSSTFYYKQCVEMLESENKCEVKTKVIKMIPGTIVSYEPIKEFLAVIDADYIESYENEIIETKKKQAILAEKFIEDYIKFNELE